MGQATQIIRRGNRVRSGGFSLIELLVVLAIILLLLALLLSGLNSARERTRAVVCAANLRQIGIAASCYAEKHGGWLVGSPNTSGNGARPGFAAGDYTDTVNPRHVPALHVFDWASPLLTEMGIRPPADTKDRYRAAVEGPMQCPGNQRLTGPVNVAPMRNLIPERIPAPSYATSRFFLYVSEANRTGSVRGTLWWSSTCIPDYYLPRLDRLRRPATKAWLADAHVVSKTQGQISNANWGFSSQGAWRSNERDPGPVVYRGNFLREEIWRHRGAINILAFDGHVESQREARDQNGLERSKNNIGQDARKANWWFPSGTQTKELPSRRAGSEPEIIVP